MIVVLLGYMGAGKTSTGKKLAEILSFDYVDLDDFISKNEQMSVTQIFDKRGEIYFRKKEAQYLRDILNSKTKLILSLGGGTPCYSNNMEFLNQSKNVHSFYLKLSLSILVDRLMAEKFHRPLISHLNSQEELMEFVGKHLFERNSFYNKAEYSIDCNNKSLLEITEEIITKLI